MQSPRELFQSLTAKIGKPLALIKGKSIRPVLPSSNTKIGNRTLGFWLWSSIIYLLALVLVFLLIKIANSEKRAEHTVENGKRAIIHLASGEIEGKAGKKSDMDNNGGAIAYPEKPDLGAPSAGQKNNEGLASAPLDTLAEKTEKGILPVAGSDGTLPWKYYARPYAQKAQRPMVAIVFTDLGLSKSLTENSLKLPHDYTLSFSPYAGDMTSWALKARATGFETLIDLPMQPENYPLSDPGPFGIMEDLSPDQNIARMHALLEKFPGFIGMLAVGGEKIMANKEAIKPYLSELKKRGLLFIYIKSDKNGIIEELAKANAFYVLGIDKIIDEGSSRNVVDMQLQSLTDIAKSRGYAIGIAHSYPTTAEALQVWLEDLKKQDVDLVPVSAIGNKLYP